jgi:hypothetical protein
LLDVNAMGYASDETGYAARRGGKGSLAFAETSRLDGPAIGDEFFAWRNKGTTGRFLLDLDETIEPTGWMPWKDGLKSGDERFTTRGDLIRYATTRLGLSPQSLRHLTHFSRAIHAPSLLPANPPGSTIDYQTLAKDKAAMNPHFAAVRVKSTFPRRNGRLAQVGEPLLAERFPLVKFDLLGESPLDEEEIVSWFGLRKESAGGALGV